MKNIYKKFFFILILLLLLFFKIYKINKKNNIQTNLIQSLYSFEEKFFNNSLYGNKINKGLLKMINYRIINKISNIIYLYIGIIYMHFQKYEFAIKYLNKFISNDFLLQARSWCLIGDAFLEKKEYKKAIEYYEKSFNYRPNKFFTPIYIIKVALIYEENNMNNLALYCYNKIIKDFFNSKYCDEAFRNKIRIELLLLN